MKPPPQSGQGKTMLLLKLEKLQKHLCNIQSKHLKIFIFCQNRKYNVSLCILNGMFYFLQQCNLDLNGLEIESFYFHRRIISPRKWIGELVFRKECLRTEDGFSLALRLNHEFYLELKVADHLPSQILRMLRRPAWPTTLSRHAGRTLCKIV